MIKKISIPEPCQEKWDGMQPRENGRYCGSCQKVVVDFSTKTEQEIIDILSENSKRKICGTFKTEQIGSTNTFLFARNNPHLMRFLAALLLAFGMTLFSCESVFLGDRNNDPPESCATTGLIIAPTYTRLMGAPMVNEGSSDSNTIYSTSNFTEPLDTAAQITSNGLTIIEGDISIESIEQKPDSIVSYPDTMPEFNFEGKNLYEYIAANIKYPPLDLEVQGTVYVSFIVNKTGKVTEVTLLRGIHQVHDEEALRLIRNMPDWKPGSTKGKAVNVRMVLPLKFKLQ